MGGLISSLALRRRDELHFVRITALRNGALSLVNIFQISFEVTVIAKFPCES